ncbi:MAG: Ig-like domain-containing protein [Oscillospiraceae bacterium]|jgi:uncharacterized protein YjdB|nr:Ig-like domain-containing protein [Oscillospiraceae bacterium]
MERLFYRFKRHIAAALLAATMLALAVVAAPPAATASAAYSDTRWHWASAEIDRWEALGALRDFESGYFRPDAAITRAEFFAILVRAFEAEEKADISRFTDVPADAWYYDIVAMANKMRIAEGTSETTMKPEANIIRQDAATLVARAFGISNENLSYLGRYGDRDQISVYAQNYVSAMTQYGYMVGSGGLFHPRDNLSRAEAVKIVDNLFQYFYRSEAGFDQLVLNGNVMSTRPESVFSGLTINGDLILCDGVGAGNASINDCVINGRLLIRGGGENSVVLSNTTVRDGIAVINPNRNTRIVTTGSTSVAELTAYSGFTLVGTGVHSVKLADSSIPNSLVTLSGVVLDSMDAGGLTSKISMPEGKISKLSFTGDSAGSQFSLGKDASVSYLTTVAPNITLLGEGRVTDAFINAPGAVFVITPGTYTVGANLTASIAGIVVSGEYLNTGNWVSRDSDNLPVLQDADGVGGGYVDLTTTRGRSANAVTVTQRATGKIPLSSAGGRPGYNIGVFIPAPYGLWNYQGTIPLLTYQNTDGGVVVMRNTPLTYQNGTYGLALRIPVTRDSGLNRGRMEEALYINWDSQLSENLIFRSGWLELEPMTWYDESTLVSMYRYARLSGYNGVIYAGPEAILRLLNGDNALGLDTNGFGAFSAQDQEDLAASLYEIADVFTTKQAIQDRLDQILSGKGALYAVNRALTAEQMRKALEHPVFARELDIEVSAGSAYGVLSETGKGRVANTLLVNRKKDYVNNAAVKTAFDKAVSDIKALETGLLVAINSAPAAPDVQKIIETKANADLLSFVPTSEPYKSFTAPQKLGLAQRIFDARPFVTVDAIAQIIRDYLASPDASNPEDDVVSGIKLTPASIDMVVGASVHLGYGAGADVQLAITTPSGPFTNPVAHVAAAVDKADFVSYNAGVVTAKAAGTAKITLTSTTDAKMKATLTVKVSAPVPATGLRLSKTFVEVEKDARLGLGPLVTVIPAKSTDKLTWTSETPAIASVNAETGEVTGLEAGFARVVVRASSGVTASVLVAVVGLTDGIMVYPESGTVGVSETMQLYAVVSPLDRANRTVRWSSEKAAIAKVDGSGVVEGVSTGDGNPASATVKITATAARDPLLTADSSIKVDRSKKTLLLDKTELTLYPGGMEQILASVLGGAGAGGDTIVWSVGTGGNNTVSVDGEGRVTGLAPGKTTVIATIDVKVPEDKEVVAVCDVTVLEGKPTITVSPNKLDLIAGDSNNGSKLVTVNFTPANMANKTVNWSVPEGDENIASVELDKNTGRVRVTGVGEGTTIIQGIPEADKDCRLEIAVTVKGIAITQFKITPKQITITEGNTELLSKLFDIVMKPDNVTDKTIEWTPGDPNTIEIRKSATGEETDVYGGSRLVALKTTKTSHQERINDADGNPLLDENGNWQFKTIWEDNPVSLVAQASNGTTIDLLVTVDPKDASQVNNIKIDMDQWIYPVGATQLMTVRYNIEGRNKDGSWNLGKQPPNIKLGWTSDKPEIAYVNEKDQLVTVSPGVAKITVTAQDSGKTDTITVIVASEGPESIAFIGLDGRAGYGRFIQMYVGQTVTVQPKITPTAAQNAPLAWTAEKWAYEDDITDDPTQDGYDSSGHLDGDYSGLIELPPQSGTNAGVLVAKAPGLVKVTASPVNPDRLATVSIAKLYELCGGNMTVFAQYLEKNNIHREIENGDYVYYSLNEWNMAGEWYVVINGADVTATIPKKALVKTVPMRLIVPGAITGGDNNFLVWITDPPLQSITLSPSLGELAADSTESVSFTATLEPAPDVVPDATPVKWEYDMAKLEMVDSPVYDSATGKYSAASFKLKAPVAADNAGTYPIVFKVSSAEDQNGPRSANKQPQLTQPRVEKSATYTLTVTEPAAATAAALPRSALRSAAPAATEDDAVIARSFTTAAGAHSGELLLAALEAGITAPDAVYTSNNPAAASVDGAGIITAMAAGEAILTAEANGRSVSVQARVEGQSSAAAAEKSVRLRASASVRTGGVLTLLPFGASGKSDLTGLAWQSSKPEIAVVDAYGRVTGLKAGKATITVTIAGTKLKDTCAVTVTDAPKKPVTGLSLSNTALTLEEGKAATLKAAFTPSAPTLKGVTWMSSDTSVAVVNESGKVTAVSPGAANIAAISDDGGYTAVCRVAVTAKPVRVSGVALSGAALTMGVGESAELKVTITPDDAANQAVTWKSSNSKIVAVSDGRLTAVKKGSATITVTTADGSKKATCKVTVK